MSRINRTYTDYLKYDFVNYSNTFKLLYKPSPGTIRLYVNGIEYDEYCKAFTYNESDNSITWKFTKELGGFDLKPSFLYIAIYDYYMEDNYSYENVEAAVNGLILINPDLLRTDFEYSKEKEKELVNYIARQISKGSLSYKAIAKLYPDLKDDISNVLIKSDSRNDFITDALNVLLLINPRLLHTNELPIAKTEIISFIEEEFTSKSGKEVLKKAVLTFFEKQYPDVEHTKEGYAGTGKGELLQYINDQTLVDIPNAAKEKMIKYIKELDNSLPKGFDADLIYDYIEYQMSIGAINRDEFLSRYPHFIPRIK